MNRHELLSDAAIRDAFERRARRADAVDLRNAIIGQTATMSQQRPWVVALADVFARPRTRLLLGAAVVALLSALFVGLMIVGQQPPAVRGGLGAYISGGDVYLTDPGWTSSIKILDDPDVSFTRVTWVDGGRRLAVEDGTAITILDPATGERTQRRADDNWLHDVTWSADGGSFAYAQDTGTSTGRVVVVDAVTGQSRIVPVDPALGDNAGVTDLAMSPDGRWLVGSSGRGVVRIDTRTGAATLIVDVGDDMFTSDFAWSPDSTRLAYVTRTPGSSGPDGDTPGTQSVVVVGADGSDPVTVVAPSRGTLQGFYHLGDQLLPAWSPDGQWVAFRAAPGLSIVRPDGSDRRDLVQEPVGSFTWSPDGRQITFVKMAQLDDATGALWELDVASGEAGPLDIDAAASISIQAVPGSQPLPSLPKVTTAGPPSSSTPLSVVPEAPASAPPADPAAAGWGLMITTGRSSDCYMAALGDLSTGTLRPLSSCGSGAHRSQMSPDGAHLLFVDHGRLVLQRLADGSRVQVTPGDQLIAHAHSYSWSPRGTWFSWTICPTPSSCTTSILPADGIGEPRTLSVRNGTGPSWSPDQARLAFATPDGVLIASGDGSDPRPLGPDVPSVSGWAPDGSQIAYVHDGNVWVVGIDGSAARPITDFEFGGIGEISWSADGQHLAIVHDGTAWLAGIDGSLTRLDLGPISGVASGVGWSPNGRILAIGLDGQSTTTTVLMPLDGRQPSVLPGVGAVTWSADSQFIAYLGPDGSTTVANADGSGARPVLPFVAEPDSLAWVRTGSPSGNQ